MEKKIKLKIKNKYYFLTSKIKFTFKVGYGLLVDFPGGAMGKEPT